MGMGLCQIFLYWSMDTCTVLILIYGEGIVSREAGVSDA